MNKGIRLALVVLLVAGAVLLAVNQSASAGGWSWTSIAARGNNQPAAQQNLRTGTVNAPPTVIVSITTPGSYSLGGVCVINVQQLASKFSIHAELLAYDVLPAKPANVTRYLAGVCSLSYYFSGNAIPELAPEDGLVKLCFATIVPATDRIFVFDGAAWLPLATTNEKNGTVECANAGKSGRYVMATVRQ